MEEKESRFKRGLLIFRILAVLIWIVTIANIYQVIRIVLLTITLEDTYVYVFTAVMTASYIFWIIMLAVITKKLAFDKGVNDYKKTKKK